MIPMRPSAPALLGDQRAAIVENEGRYRADVVVDRDADGLVHVDIHDLHLAVQLGGQCLQYRVMLRHGAHHSTMWSRKRSPHRRGRPRYA